ncbi:FAD-dependent protein [Marispirochaeta aestuarii]|uniref:NAD(P)/FAD-dependent oxidoreductase n=1 Tax=Marispirochaeta aestuarii TaxID=1963862 RepID=UPI0029C721AF|nr:NAD(P)-binding protein [Marispirochaeta aestuarii]
METEISLSAGTTREDLDRIVRQRFGTGPYRILRQSLDARKKPKLFWKYRISTGLPPVSPAPEHLLPVERRQGRGRAVVVGSGPAGFFAADILNRAGFSVTLLEQGPPARERRGDILSFEKGGPLLDRSNYAFGEGGAGTFSDGKLTSRTKHISMEREYIRLRYVQYGAPEEILWMAHPHIGSNNLFTLVQMGRQDLLERGVDVRFRQRVVDLLMHKGRCSGVRTDTDEFPADYTLLAPGHSAFPLFRRLYARGAGFQSKGFSLGFRIEHPRELINRAQWGRESVPGLKAAEYRLTAKAESGRGIYTFCMCPGGFVVPAAWREGLNIVNGVSMYERSSPWSNAAVLAAVKPEEIFPKADTPMAVLDSLEALEARAFEHLGAYQVPGTLPPGLPGGRLYSSLPQSSFPFPVVPLDYRQLYPEWLLQDLSDGISRFARQIRGFDTGLILGLETTSSAALKILRSDSGEVLGIPGLYIAGEGSGSAGGIMSSAVDGLRIALQTGA